MFLDSVSFGIFCDKTQMSDHPALNTESSKDVPSTVLNHRRHLTAEERSKRSVLLDFWDLSKPEISLTVAMSAAAGYILGVNGGTILTANFLWVLFGTLLLSVGCGALNHYLEIEIDSTMHRTANRPLPSGRMTTQTALTFGIASIIIGMIFLLQTNLLTSILGLSTVVLYLWVYTPLKKRSTINTLIGCLPGALPALGGWTAATGQIGITGLAFFGVMFFWQMPHFLSLSWMYRKDYSRGKLAMTVVNDKTGINVSSQAVFYTLLAIALSVIPFLAGASSYIYLATVLLFGSYLLYRAIVFFQERTNINAKSLLKASVYYIPGLLIAVLVDSLL